MKNKALITRIAAILAFVILLSSVLWWLKFVLVLKRPDGITSMQNLYAQEEDTCDIILLGSSHVGINFDCATLWEEQGYASYALWGSVQPFWNSYYFLQEALKTQSPKLVILDTYAAYCHEEYSDPSRQLTNVVGMKMGMNRLMATLVTAPPNRWADLLLEYPVFHSRIEELTADDFRHFPWTEDLVNSKGTDTRYGSTYGELPELTDTAEIAEVSPKQERYLRKIIELCAQEKIELLLIKGPVIQERPLFRPYLNYLQTIAREYGVPFVDMNALDGETGLCSSDIYFDGYHVNTAGGRKVSSWLGNYIRANYDIPDRRGDSRYESWNVFTRNMQVAYLKQILTAGDYLEELQRAGYPVLLVQNCRSVDETFQYTLMQLREMGIEPDARDGVGKKAMWIPVLSGDADAAQNSFVPENRKWSEVYFEEPDCHIEFSDVLTIHKGDEMILHDNYPGLFLFVFDPVSMECVDIVSMHSNAGYALTHNPVA